MDITEFDRLATSLGPVRQRTVGPWRQWHHRGRLVARQLDDEHVVVRTPFETREALVREHPNTFTVPHRFRRHMMVVADLAQGDPDAIEDAVTAAWHYQTRSLTDGDRGAP